jgi:hypothetical protein
VSASATYVYCIVSTSQPLKTTGTPAGPPGTLKARALEVRPGRYVVVSDAPLDQFGEAQLARRLSDLEWVSRAAVAHDAVTESFMAHADAVVPMKLFTLFTSDDRALEQLRSRWTRVESIIRRLNKHEEWGVRLVFDDTRARADKPAAAASSGRDYLMAKRRQGAAKDALSSKMRKVAGDILKALRPFSRDARRRAVAATPGSRSRLLLDAAFLVPRVKAARFRATAERQAKKLAPDGYALQITGPWPPYSFVDKT